MTVLIYNQWVTKWLLITNHKRIAILYFIFGMFSGVVGTAISVLIRLELAQPGNKCFLFKFFRKVLLYGIISFIYRKFYFKLGSEFLSIKIVFKIIFPNFITDYLVILCIIVWRNCMAIYAVVENFIWMEPFLVDGLIYSKLNDCFAPTEQYIYFWPNLHGFSLFILWLLGLIFLGLLIRYTYILICYFLTNFLPLAWWTSALSFFDRIFLFLAALSQAFINYRFQLNSIFALTALIQPEQKQLVKTPTGVTVTVTEVGVEDWRLARMFRRLWPWIPAPERDWPKIGRLGDLIGINPRTIMGKRPVWCAEFPDEPDYGQLLMHNVKDIYGHIRLNCMLPPDDKTLFDESSKKNHLGFPKGSLKGFTADNLTPKVRYQILNIWLFNNIPAYYKAHGYWIATNRIGIPGTLQSELHRLTIENNPHFREICVAALVSDFVSPTPLAKIIAEYSHERSYSSFTDYSKINT